MATEAWVAIGAVATAFTGFLGKLGLNRIRNGRGNGITPAARAVVDAIKEEGRANKERHEDSMKLLREVRGQQETDEAWRKGFEAGHKKG